MKNLEQIEYTLPIYSIGPAIPFLFEFEENYVSTYISSPNGTSSYLEWLDSQPASSLLSEQLDEIAAGLKSSCVRFLWVARDETSRLKNSCGDLGLIVSWCDQLKVLGHSSVGGFWTNCGWNSTLEDAFFSYPLLTLPLHFDQHSNEKQIIEAGRFGWSVREKATGDENIVSREEIAKLVQEFMDQESIEVQNIRQSKTTTRDLSSSNRERRIL